MARVQTHLDELNTMLRSKRLVTCQPWQAAIGRSNDTLLAAEYETLEAYEREYAGLHSDQACMDVSRRMTEHVDGIPWSELWWTPSMGSEGAPRPRG